MFTAEEYERVWDTVGGHAGQLFSLHSYLRLGWNLNQAIESMNSECARMLIYILEGREGSDYKTLIELGVNDEKALNLCIQSRRDLLTQLANSHFSMATDKVSLDQKLTLRYLCMSNVLWMDVHMITPIHQTYQNAMEFLFGLDITLSKTDVYKLVVNKYQLFTAKEFDEVWYTTGGKIGLLFEMHRLVQSGMTMDEATKQMIEASRGTLNNALRSKYGPDYDALIEQGVVKHKALRICFRNRRDILKKLTKFKFVMAIMKISLEHELSLEHLCASKVLKEDGLNVAAISRTIEIAIQQYFMADKVSSVPPFKYFRPTGHRLGF